MPGWPSPFRTTSSARCSPCAPPTRIDIDRSTDLRGRRVGTLGATLAYDLLIEAQGRDGVVPVTYEDDVHPYNGSVLGRVDAVVLDAILAQRGVRRNTDLTNQPAVLAVGHYVGVLSARRTYAIG